MSQIIYQIYDKIFKKILTLSATAVVGLINGLFGTDYPPDSTITYHWTEFVDDRLRHTLADTILTINGCHSYHLEAQMEKDEDIVFRIFDYGYSHARTTGNGLAGDVYTLYFPEPKVIYLFSSTKAPDSYTLHLDFGSQGSFDYTVPTFKYLESTPQELTDKKMIILIPFELLKLREVMKKERSEENKSRLISLIQNDIIGSINKNLEVGNITNADAARLKTLTQMLYTHIYSHYEELKEVTEMTDESLILDIDIWEDKYEKIVARATELESTLAEKESALAKIESALAELDSALAEKESALAEKDSALAEKDSALAELDSALAEKDSALAEKDSAIAQLEAELNRLKASAK